MKRAFSLRVSSRANHLLGTARTTRTCCPDEEIDVHMPNWWHIRDHSSDAGHKFPSSAFTHLAILAAPGIAAAVSILAATLVCMAGTLWSPEPVRIVNIVDRNQHRGGATVRQNIDSAATPTAQSHFLATPKGRSVAFPSTPVASFKPVVANTPTAQGQSIGMIMMLPNPIAFGVIAQICWVVVLGILLWILPSVAAALNGRSCTDVDRTAGAERNAATTIQFGRCLYRTEPYRNETNLGGTGDGRTILAR